MSNWNTVLSSTRNLNDVLIVLQKVLALLQNKADVTTIDEALDSLATLDQQAADSIREMTNRLNQFGDDADAATNEAIMRATVRGFATETTLKAWKPNFDGARAKADDTKKIWRWELTSAAGATPITGNWVDTGLSELDLSKNHTDTQVNLIKSEFEPVLSSILLGITADANNIIINGNYIINSIASVDYINFPTPHYGVLKVVNRGRTVAQIFHTTVSNRLFYRTRYDGVWGDWKETQSKIEIEALISAAVAGLRFSKISAPIINAETKFDANNIITDQTTIITSNNAENLLNLPYATYGVLSAIAGGQTVTQFFHTTINNRLCYRTRYNGVWSDWSELLSKIQIEALISAAVAGIRVSKISQPAVNAANPFDADNFTSDQTLIINSANNQYVSNLPYNTYGVLSVISGGYTVTQLFHTTISNRLCYRTRYNGAWREWKELQSKSEIEALIASSANTTLASAKDYTDVVVASLNGLANYVEKGLLTIDKDNKLVDVNSVKNTVAFFGSSTISYMQDQLEALFLANGYTNIIKGGQGGEIVENTGARFGSFDCLIEPVEIPASGSVNVASNMPVISALKAFNGWLGGIHGTLSYSSANTSLIFTRTTAGEKVVLSEVSKLTPDINNDIYGGVLIINVGKNNLTNGTSSINNVDLVFNKTVDFVNKMSNVFKRVLILDQFINTDGSQFGSATRIKQYNDKLYEKYGNMVIRSHEYITGSKIWLDTGITPTTVDLEQQSRGEKPTSLSRDSGHLNSAAEAAVISNLITPRLQKLGWL
jgi:hypothetical protein